MSIIKLVWPKVFNRLVESPTLTLLAESVHQDALLPTRFPDPRQLIFAVGGRVCCSPGVKWCEVRDGVIEYEWQEDQRERGLAIYWGLATWLLEDARIPRSEADVWALTSFLVVPSFIRCKSPRFIAQIQLYAPAWFVFKAVRVE